MPSKPVAKGRGRRPRARQSRKSATADRDAKHARSRVKARLQALEARYSTLLSWVGELHVAVTGESVRAHEDDMEGAFGPVPLDVIDEEE